MNKLKPYAKTVVAVIGGVATVVDTTWGADTTAGKVAAVVLVALTAAGVYRVKNAPLPEEPTP